MDIILVIVKGNLANTILQINVEVKYSDNASIAVVGLSKGMDMSGL